MKSNFNNSSGTSSLYLLLFALLILFFHCSLAETTPQQTQCLRSLPEVTDFCELNSSTENTMTCNIPITVPHGLIAVTDQQQISKAFGDGGEGGICCGKVVSATDAITVYRAWTKRSKKLGNWWSLTIPPKSKDAYRSQDDICSEWAPYLMFVSTCKLSVGTLAAIGPGQSACCSDGNFYPESDVLQLYIPNAEQSVTNCTTSPWRSH